jgi:hypothetical protein
MTVQLKPVKFTDDAWREVRSLFPKLPDDARRPMEDRVAMYVHLDRSPPPAARRDILLHLLGLAEELRRGLAELDGETLMALLEGGGGKADRHMSQLFTERQAQLAHLAHWLEFAANSVPRGRPGRDGSRLEFLVDQCDMILGHFGAGKLSRSDANDRTKKFTKLILDTIKAATGTKPVSTGGSAVRKTVTRRGKKAGRI